LEITPPKKSAAQKFRPAGPIRPADKNLHYTNKFQSLPTKCHAFKSPTTRRFARPNTLSAESSDQRLQGLLCNLRWISTARARYPQKITRNLAFHRFQSLSVEFIEEKNRRKVIHSRSNLRGSNLETHHSGGTQVVQINI
jgi:hypothetical protein